MFVRDLLVLARKLFPPHLRVSEPSVGPAPIVLEVKVEDFVSPPAC